MILSRMFKTVFIFISLLSICYIVASPSPSIRGDGREYILMSQSFINHGSPRLEYQDAKDVVNLFKSNDISFSDHILDCDKNKDCGISMLSGAYFPSTDGKLFSYHFSFYSLVNIPAYIAAMHFSLSPTTSFYTTNAIFLLVSLFFVFFYLRDSIGHRALIAFLLVTQTTLLYLKWPHPETMTISLMIIAMCLIKREMFYLASFVFAISSLQYQPLGIVSALVIIYGFISSISKNKITSINKLFTNNKLILSAVLNSFVCGLIVLTPSLFYMYHFSSPNIIALNGGASSDLITFERLFSIYYDLNQGAILLYPVVLVFSPFIFIASIFKKKHRGSNLPLLFTIISLVSAIPCLSTANWNSGAENVMRYAFWVSSPLVFAFSDFIFCITKKQIRNLLLCITVTSQIIFLLMNIEGKFFSDGHKSSSYIALLAYTNIPSMYNPDAEIYIERALNAELPLDKLVVTGKFPGYVKNGYLKKLIVHKGISEKSISPCPNVKPSVIKTTHGFLYLNYDEKCMTSKDGSGLFYFSPHVK